MIVPSSHYKRTLQRKPYFLSTLAAFAPGRRRLRVLAPRLNRGGSAIMPYYRIYLLNRTNRIVGVEQAVWLTDHSALSRAAELVDNRHAAEVWDSNRLVGTMAAARSEISGTGIAGQLS
jgi:hypothetical protein